MLTNCLPGCGVPLHSECKTRVTICNIMPLNNQAQACKWGVCPRLADSSLVSDGRLNLKRLLMFGFFGNYGHFYAIWSGSKNNYIFLFHHTFKLLNELASIKWLFIKIGLLLMGLEHSLHRKE